MGSSGGIFWGYPDVYPDLLLALAREEGNTFYRGYIGTMFSYSQLTRSKLNPQP